MQPVQYGPSGAYVARRLSAVALAVLAVAGTTARSAAQGRATADIDRLPTLRYREELRLGSRDDPNLGFSRVLGVAVDRDSAVYVADGLDQTIRMFDGTGKLICTFGGKGRGPGEFTNLSSFGVADDKVWAMDGALMRLTVFGRAGSVESTGRVRFDEVMVPIQDQDANGWVLPLTLRSDGFFLGWMAGYRRRDDRSPNAIGPHDTVLAPLVRFRPSGAPVDTIGWERYPPAVRRQRKKVDLASGSYQVPLPPTGEPLKVHLAQTRWVVEAPLPSDGNAASFRVTRRGDGDDTIFDRTYAYTPRRYSDEVLDSIAFASTPRSATLSFAGPPARPTGRALRRIQQALRDGMSFPPYQPAVQDAVGGIDGTLWLREGDQGRATFRWLVLGSDGVPLGAVDLPRRWKVRWVGAGSFIVEKPDELDIPWVLRFGLLPPGH